MNFTFEQYVICVAMFILGQAAHLFLIKIPAIKNRSNAVGKPFKWKEWWNCDFNIIIGTQVIGALVLLGLKEIITWKPGVIEYVRWFFAGLGAFGSTIAMAKGSQFEKSLVNLIDIKSNVSDAVTGGTTTVSQTIREAAKEDIQVKPTVKP
jgi:hypothetical protein